MIFLWKNLFKIRFRPGLVVQDINDRNFRLQRSIYPTCTSLRLKMDFSFSGHRKYMHAACIDPMHRSEKDDLGHLHVLRIMTENIMVNSRTWGMRQTGARGVYVVTDSHVVYLLWIIIHPRRFSFSHVFCDTWIIIYILFVRYELICICLNTDISRRVLVYKYSRI